MNRVGKFEPVKALKEVLQFHDDQPYALKLHAGSLSTRFSEHPLYDLEILKGNGKMDNVRFLLSSKKKPEEKSVFFIDRNDGRSIYLKIIDGVASGEHHWEMLYPRNHPEVQPLKDALEKHGGLLELFRKF